MAYTEEKKMVLIALNFVKKVSKYASTINPLFGIVTALVGAASKGLEGEETNDPYKEFQKLNSQLDTISEESKQCLGQIIINEVNDNLCQHEYKINFQYEAYSCMVAEVDKDPENAGISIQKFKKVYESTMMDNSLEIYYRGVMETNTNFGRSLLNVYLDDSQKKRETMEKRCSELCQLFYKGLMALVSYTVVTEDDEEEVKDKWEKRMKEIQEKMQEALSQCN